MQTVQQWLVSHWLAGAWFMAGIMLAVMPLLDTHNLAVLLIYLHSPGYMLHQVEEHTSDRFRTFINTRIFGGVEALTPNAILIINLPGVWGLNLAALYAASLAEPCWGLAAPYLMLVNALGHLVATVRVHGYNPGVITSLLIFLPLASVTLWLVPATLVLHAVGLVIALATHAAIAIHTMHHAAALGSANRGKTNW